MKNSDLILCEDTRISSKLLAKYNISAPLKIYNDNSDKSTRSLIYNEIINGKVISIISDAGTPLISDPGYKLIKLLKEKKIHIDVIPGACAAIAALTISGLPTDKFMFIGFLPKTEQAKRKIFSDLVNINCSLIFYETANRILKSIDVAIEILGDKNANISRELTKLHQESNTLKLSELKKYYQENIIKGEIVFIIDNKNNDNNSAEFENSLKKEIESLLRNNLTAKSITNELYNKYNNLISKKEIYNLTNNIKKQL